MWKENLFIKILDELIGKEVIDEKGNKDGI